MHSKKKTPSAVTLEAQSSTQHNKGNESMKNSISVLDKSQLTMSSREMASLTNKEHKNVLRVIRELINGEILDAQYEPLKFEYRNQWFDYYELNKRDSLVVVARLSPEFTAKIVDRWQELESKVNNDPIVALNDPAFLRGTLLTYTEKVIELEHKVEEMLPAVEVYDRIVNADGAVNLTMAAKAVQYPPRKFNETLHKKGWIYRAGHRKQWLGYQDKVKSGYLTHKVYPYTLPDGTEMMNEQVMVTPKGLTKLSQMLTTNA